MKIEGHTFRIKDSTQTYTLLWRVYGTKRVERAASGRVLPKPGTWEPVLDVKCELRDGVYTVPDFELDFTRPGGWRFYRVVGVRDGREDWSESDADVSMILTPELVEEEGGSVDWPRWQLANLERNGVVDPERFREA